MRLPVQPSRERLETGRSDDSFPRLSNSRGLDSTCEGSVFHTSSEGMGDLTSRGTAVRCRSDVGGRNRQEDANPRDAQKQGWDRIPKGHAVVEFCNKFIRALPDLGNHRLTSWLPMKTIYVVNHSNQLTQDTYKPYKSLV